MKAQKCPVCSGEGKHKNKECHGCSGKGWIEVHENYYPTYPTVPTIPYEPYPYYPYPNYPYPYIWISTQLEGS